MHLRIKSSSKIIKPCSMVDMVFKTQGFKKKITRYISYYHIKIKDNCTNTNYELQIPIKEILQKKREPLYKIQDITILSKSPLNKNQQIPTEIIQAANEKVREVLSYLVTDSKSKI